jgi:hypothetical protein
VPDPRTTPAPTDPPSDVTPAVDVVIAVHRDTRPVERAVASVLEGGVPSPYLRVTVVCHNIEPAAVARRLGTLTPDGSLPTGVRLLELEDGRHSPAGPFNHGIDHATGRFVSVMGSDDTVDPGTYAAWLAIGDAHTSAAVVAAQRTTSSGRVPTPVVRPWRSLDLDPVRDGLAYRTAPLGLVRRTEFERLGLRFTENLPSGEDQEFTARLWFGGGRIDYARRAGDYVIHDDQDDRMTQSRQDVPTLFRFATHLVGSAWFGRQDRRVQEVLVTKILRVHVVPAVTARESSGGWSDRDRQEASTTVDALVDAAPGALSSLSLAELDVVDALLDVACPTEELVAAAAAARRFGRPRTLLTRNPLHLLRPDAPLRWTVSSAAMKVAGRLASRQPRSSGTTDFSKSSMPERS